VRRMASDYVRILELMTTSALDETLRFAPAPLPAADGDRAGLARHQTTVAASLRRAICTLAAQKGASHEAVMLAVFAVLVGRVTQRARLTIDVPPGRAVAFELNDSMEFDDLLAHTQAGLASGAAAAGSTEPSAAARPGLRLGSPARPWHQPRQLRPPQRSPGRATPAQILPSQTSPPLAMAFFARFRNRATASP